MRQSTADVLWSRISLGRTQSKPAISVDILIEDEFEEKQNKLLEENCHHFEATEENKLIYMDIFKKYTELIETHLEQRLQEEVEEFNMDLFYELLR